MYQPQCWSSSDCDHSAVCVLSSNKHLQSPGQTLYGSQSSEVDTEDKICHAPTEFYLSSQQLEGPSCFLFGHWCRLLSITQQHVNSSLAHRFGAELCDVKFFFSFHCYQHDQHIINCYQQIIFILQLIRLWSGSDVTWFCNFIGGQTY